MEGTTHGTIAHLVAVFRHVHLAHGPWTRLDDAHQPHVLLLLAFQPFFLRELGLGRPRVAVADEVLDDGLATGAGSAHLLDVVRFQPLRGVGVDVAAVVTGHDAFVVARAARGGRR
jgi:hypothetical protein